jgi:hypothetical protein
MGEESFLTEDFLSPKSIYKKRVKEYYINIRLILAKSKLKAFPLRERWHDEGVTDEVEKA